MQNLDESITFRIKCHSPYLDKSNFPNKPQQLKKVPYRNNWQRATNFPELFGVENGAVAVGTVFILFSQLAPCKWSVTSCVEIKSLFWCTSFGFRFTLNIKELTDLQSYKNSIHKTKIEYLTLTMQHLQKLTLILIDITSISFPSIMHLLQTFNSSYMHTT